MSEKCPVCGDEASILRDGVDLEDFKKNLREDATYCNRPMTELHKVWVHINND